MCQCSSVPFKSTVTEVIDGDTFVISPGWKWNDESGDRVRPAGYDAPERNTLAGAAAKKNLEDLILRKEVEIREAHRIDRGRLVCEVYFNGKNLADYFSKYK